MKKVYNVILLLVFVLILSYDCKSQLLVDTVTFEPILKGNTILYGSSKTGWCRVLGYNLISFSSDGCTGDLINNEVEEISNIECIDSTLTIKISVESNCGHSFLGEIEYVEDTILNINSHAYGNLELCDCHFYLIYKIQYSLERVKMVYNSSKANLKYIMVNRNQKTLRNIEALLIKK